MYIVERNDGDLFLEYAEWGVGLLILHIDIIEFDAFEVEEDTEDSDKVSYWSFRLKAIKLRRRIRVIEVMATEARLQRISFLGVDRSAPCSGVFLDFVLFFLDHRRTRGSLSLFRNCVYGWAFASANCPR